MKSARDRIQEIFAGAMGKSPAEQAQFLAEACRGEPALRRQVETLLRAHDQAGDFLQRTIQVQESDFVMEKTGGLIGRYKLLEQIGEGGFGVVWMAEQEEPVRRRVALKIIKLGMDTKEVVARFEAERQALAMMDHPNIASVFDGGATGTGRPYFVMELVRGVRITEYCEAHQLSIPERLELFLQVCAAVQHAHQKGIIHRDLKPSNVLVTVVDDRPVPKVIDFGIAKATAQRLTDKTVFTRFQQVIGTPAYMSPEQAGSNREDIDTRSDIYSLGVLLYELLTGKTPFETGKLLEAGLEAVLKTIREEEPPKPSTRLTSLAKEELAGVATRRRLAPDKLGRLVRGELDWIVMKALEKDRARRYETANGLAGDIRRHLNAEPVVAAPPSAGYRLRRFAHRHRSALAAVSVFLLLVIAGTTSSVWQAIRATRNQREAEHQTKVATNATAQAAKLYEQSQAARQELERSLYGNRIQLAYRHWRDGEVSAAEQELDACPETLRDWEWNYLKHLCHSELFSFDTDEQNLIAILAGNLDLSDLERTRHVAFSADNRQLVVARLGDVGRKKVFQFWELSGGKAQKPPGIENSPILALSRTRRLAVSAANGDTGASVVDVFTGRTVCQLTNVTPDASRFAFGVNDDLLAVFNPGEGGGYKGRPSRLETYSLATGNPLGSFSLPAALQHDTLTLAVSSNHFAAFLDFGARLAVWSPTKDESLHQFNDLLKLENDEAGQLAFSADGSVLVLAANRSVCSVDVVNSKVLARVRLPTGVEISGMALHPRKPWAILSSRALGSQIENHVSVVDWNTGDVVWSWRADEGNLGRDRYTLYYDAGGRVPIGPWFGAEDLALSNDGEYVAAGGWDGAVRVWSLETGRQVSIHRGHSSRVISVALNPGGNRLASLDCIGTAKVWDALSESGSPWIPAGYHTFTAPVEAAISANGETLMTTEQVWQPRSGRVLELPGVAVPGSLSPDGSVFVDERDGVSVRSVVTGEALAWLPTGQLDGNTDFQFDQAADRLALHESSGRVEVWELASGKLKFKQTVNGSVATPGAQRLAFSHDGRTIAVTFPATNDNLSVSIKAWDVETGRELFEGPSRSWSVRLRPDGRVLLLSETNHFTWVDLSNGQRRSLAWPGSFECDAVTWSPDQQRLLCTFGKTTSVCDLRTGNWLPLATGPVIGTAAWSPNGRRIAFLDKNYRLNLADAETGQMLLPFEIEGEFVSFSRDGRWLSIISPRETMQVLDGTPPGSPAPALPQITHHQIGVRTGVTNLNLVAFLMPESKDETFNNLIRHCVLRAPYLYALSREGTLWTFRLPDISNRDEAATIQPVAKLKTAGNDGDMVLKASTLLLTAKQSCLELVSLDEPAQPKVIGAAGRGLPIAGYGGQLMLAGDRLFYGDHNSAGTALFAMFNVSDPRQPVLLGATNWPAGILCGCAVSGWLVLSEQKGAASSLCVLDYENSWPPKILSRVQWAEQWLKCLVAVGTNGVIAMNDRVSRLVQLDDTGSPQPLPDSIATGGRSAVALHSPLGEITVLEGDVLQCDGRSYKLVGHIPRAMHRDGSPYRASAEGPWVAIPGEDRVWLYRWMEQNAPKNPAR